MKRQSMQLRRRCSVIETNQVLDLLVSKKEPQLGEQTLKKWSAEGATVIPRTYPSCASVSDLRHLRLGMSHMRTCWVGGGGRFEEDEWVGRRGS